MNWTNYFDKIYLVNLPENTERLKSAAKQLSELNIPYTVWPATKRLNGKEGLNFTMKELFFNALHKNYNRILVLEDDVKFVQDPNKIMPLCVKQLQQLSCWDMFYLGLNMHEDKNLFPCFFAPNLLKVGFCFSTHAVAYSAYAMKTLLATLEHGQTVGGPVSIADVPFDEIINRTISPIGNYRYASYPMIATQQDGWSDIEQKQSTYQYLQDRYNHSVKHLLTRDVN